MKFVTVFLLVSCIAVLSACGNTWQGIKKDSSEAGKSIGEAAESAGKAIKEATE